MQPTYSEFASAVETETAFDVLAVAKQLKAAGKDVIELEIGDSPFPTSTSAAKAGIEAIEADHCHYGPSLGIPEFRQAAAEYVNREYGLSVSAENVVTGPGAKNFEQLFCEAFVNPGDGVLVFSPYFPTYAPNIARRGARMVLSDLKQANAFRPDLADIEKFIEEDPSPKAIFLNTPHNPTGGIALEEDLHGLADLVRGKDIAVLSDEPYDQMVWSGRHRSPLECEGMIDQCVAAYTFSKSFSMSGWRLGYAVSSPDIINMLGKLTNTCLSCVPPFTQMAGAEAMRRDHEERDGRMADFQAKVELLVNGLNEIDGVHCLMPGGSFYVFPSIAPICNRLGISSHGLALYLLKGADDQLGVACLGGECFGTAGEGFLRFSCAEPNDRLLAALEFLKVALERSERIEAFLTENEHFRLATPYAE